MFISKQGTCGGGGEEQAIEESRKKIKGDGWYHADRMILNQIKTMMMMMMKNHY